MLRYYCQFSYGGFRTYRIDGALPGEVTVEESREFPDEANLCFTYGGTRMAYRRLADGQLCVAVREIPGPTTDSDGRAINCGIQIIGSEDDKPLLDKAVARIYHNMAEFEALVADIFDLRGGLHIDGARVAEYVAGCAGYDGPGAPVAPCEGDSVMLFVPSSPAFGVDKKVTLDTCRTLGLPARTLKVTAWLPGTGTLPVTSGNVITNRQTMKLLTAIGAVGGLLLLYKLIRSIVK